MRELWNGEGNKTHATPHDLWMSCYPLSAMRQAGSLHGEQLQMRGSVAPVPSAPHGPSDPQIQKSTQGGRQGTSCATQTRSNEKSTKDRRSELKKRKTVNQRGEEQRSTKVARTCRYGDGVAAIVGPSSDIGGSVKQMQSALEDETAKRRRPTKTKLCMRMKTVRARGSRSCTKNPKTVVPVVRMLVQKLPRTTCCA